MAQIHHGIVLGNDIRLDRAPGFPTGQEVEVTLRPVGSIASAEGAPDHGSQRFDESTRKKYEATILASDGAWADDPEDLQTMLAELKLWRQSDRPPIAP
jgi:hypothetical protein